MIILCPIMATCILGVYWCGVSRWRIIVWYSIIGHGGSVTRGYCRVAGLSWIGWYCGISTISSICGICGICGIFGICGICGVRSGRVRILIWICWLIKIRIITCISTVIIRLYYASIIAVVQGKFQKDVLSRLSYIKRYFQLTQTIFSSTINYLICIDFIKIGLIH